MRQEVDHLRRLPVALLMRFAVKTHPDTGQPVMVPEGLDRDGPPPVPKGLYSFGTYAGIASLGPYLGRGAKVWVKLVPAALRQRVLRAGHWHPDMAGHVLARMRRRVLDECCAACLSADVDRVPGGPHNWAQAGEVMAVLDFRPRPPDAGGVASAAAASAAAAAAGTAAGTAADSGDDSKDDSDGKDRSDDYDQDSLENMTSAGWRRREKPPPMDAERRVARVGGKLVPVHDVQRMLGAEEAARLRAAWRVESGHELVAVMLTQRTADVLLWWMRLRGFLGFEYMPGRP